MLYHFCNDSFGLPYYREMQRLQRTHRFALTTVVERPLPRSRAERMLTLLRRDALPLVVTDVNAAAFSERIHTGDAGIITGFARIFREPLIARFTRLINLHPSVLPLYRGPAPTACALQNGETMSGYTFHDVTARIDAGPVIYQAAASIAGCTTPLDAAHRLARLSMPAFETVVLALLGRGAMPSALIDAKGVYRVHHAYCSGVHAPAADA